MITPETLRVIGRLYEVAELTLASLDLDWWLQIASEFRHPTVRLRVIDRRGEPRRTWECIWTEATIADGGYGSIEEGIRELRKSIFATRTARVVIEETLAGA